MSAIDQINAYGALTAPNSVSNLLTAQVMEAILNDKAYIILESVTPQALSINQATPTVLDNWTVVASRGISLQGDDIQNDTGRVIPALSGTIGLKPEVDGGGGDRLVRITSEKSPDGVAPYVLSDQIRDISTKNNAETYATKESYVINFGIGERARFVAYADSAITVAPSSGLFRNESVTGPAALWILVEA